MAVFRVQRTRDYTVMSNYHLRDQNLTLKAKAAEIQKRPVVFSGDIPFAVGD